MTREFIGDWPYGLFAVVLGTTQRGNPIFGRRQDGRRCENCKQVKGLRRVWLGNPWRDLGAICDACWPRVAYATDLRRPDLGELGPESFGGP